MEKKKKILTYVAAMFIPVLIFMVCSLLSGHLPFGDEVLNAYDSYSQYPGILLDYIRNLKLGNMFYSFGGSLGYNLFGTITYYAFSPLNLLAVFASPENYPYFVVIMTYLRFALLGGSMCFYLSHKNLKPLYVILFSTIYSLMGFTSAYYYNYLWIDSIIMVSFVIHGLDKLIDGKGNSFYLVTLSLTIIINYYIGYMICIFCLLWFIYRMVQVEGNKRNIAKNFFVNSLLAGGISAFVLLPSAFALLRGKAELYGTADYFGISRNAGTFFYTLSTGSFQIGDQSFGPGVIYSSILVVVLSIMYFFNKSFSKKEKIATFIMISFFYLSFSFNLLNYAWQMFQSPIWWPSRFAFLFSFFLITLAAKTVNSLDKMNLSNLKRTIVIVTMSICFILSALYKWKTIDDVQIFTYFYLGFSILLFLEYMFLADKKGFMVMVVIFTFIEISINTFNSLKTNYRYVSISNYHFLKKNLPPLIGELNVENDGLFYRMELANKFTSNDGAYFGYNGINFFNSVRNVETIRALEAFGIKVYNDCHVNMLNFDPVTLSLLGVKYVYGDLDYFDKKNERFSLNRYPLGIGFMVEKDVEKFEFGDDAFFNKNELVKTMSGLEKDLYYKIGIDEFEYEKNEYSDIYDYSFKSDGHFLIFLEDFGGNLIINGKTSGIDEKFVEIKEDDEVKIHYDIVEEYERNEVFFTLLDVDSYEEHMKSFENVLIAKKNEDGHLLKGTVEVTDEKSYLYTSIPYEKGMKVYVDDVLCEADIILENFVGVQLDEGEHEITIDYVPKGLNVGIAVSIVSLGVSLYLQKGKKSL